MSADRPSGMHRVFSDLVDLALLQLQLFAVDGREAGRRGLGAALYLGFAAALLISTATVALFGFGWLLHEVAEWPLGWALLAVAGISLLLILAILWLAYLSIKKAAAAMQEVGAEFADNLEWLRAVMGSPSPRRPPYPSGDDFGRGNAGGPTGSSAGYGPATGGFGAGGFGAGGFGAGGFGAGSSAATSAGPSEWGVPQAEHPGGEQLKAVHSRH